MHYAFSCSMPWHHSFWQRLLSVVFLIFTSLPLQAQSPWQAKILSYQPLSLQIPAEIILDVLATELEALTGDEFVENSVRFRFYEPTATLLGQGRIEIRTKIVAQTSVPLIGRITADARAKLWLHASVANWETHVRPLDSDVKFSNDLINAAFRLVRPRVERRLIQLARDSLEPLNQSIKPGSSHTLQLVQDRGSLDGILELSGFNVTLSSRSKTQGGS